MTPARHQSSLGIVGRPRQSVTVPGASFQFGLTSIRLFCAPHLAHLTLALPWDRDVAWVGRHVDHRPVPAGVIEATGDQTAHALPAHVGKVHRRAGTCLGFLSSERPHTMRWTWAPTPPLEALVS
jgi:hypothetical protein